MSTRTERAVFALTALGFLTACPVVFAPDVTPPASGPVVVLRETEEPAGDACTHGGTRIEHGLDLDSDGVLSDDEAEGEPMFVCRGAPGGVASSSLVEQSPLASGEGCANGGIEIRSGIDADGDGALSDDEVRETMQVCHGETGADGTIALVVVTPVVPGSECTQGGQRIETGYDDDDDGLLDAVEVALTSFVCDGVGGPDGQPGENASLSLVDVDAVGPGIECPEGGAQVTTGVDDDGDGTLTGDEIDAVGVVCDALGEGFVLGSGKIEGSAIAPVPLVVDATARLSTVGALSSSIYAFTTAMPESAPYVIDVTGEDTPLVVQLFGDAALSDEVSLLCTRTADRQHCTTGPLSPDAAFVLTITEPSSSGGAFGLRVSLGEQQGTTASPIELTLPTGVPLDERGAVAAGAESVFGFSVPDDEAYTIALTGLTSTTSEPGISWTVDDGVSLHATCDDARQACAAGHLRANVAYRLRVQTTTRGAAFGVSFVLGDDLTPELPLNTVLHIDDLVYPDARVFQFRTSSSSIYTLRLFSLYANRNTTIYEHPPHFGSAAPEDVLDDASAVSGLDNIYADYGAVLDSLEPDRVYYIVVVDWGDTPDPFDILLSDRGGDEADITLTVGVPHTGTVDGESNYTFTALVDGVHTVRFLRPILSVEPPEVFLYDAASSTYLTELGFPTTERLADDRAIVTGPLVAGQEIDIVVESYIAEVYEILVEAGDTVTTPIAEGSTVIALPPQGIVLLHVELATPSAVSLSSTGANARVHWASTFQVAAGYPFYTPGVLLHCVGPACAKVSAAPAGRSFISVENMLPIVQTVTLDVALPTSTIMLDAPVTQDLTSTEAFRVVYVNDAEVPHQFLVENPNAKTHSVRVRDATFAEVYAVTTSASATSRTVNLPVGTAGAPLPIGVWFLEVKGNSGTTAPFTVTVTRP